MYILNVCQTLSLVPMQLDWLARLVITRRDEAQSTLAVSCRIVGQQFLSINSLDTARLQIPTVSVLSPSAIAFESFIECFLAALCQHHPC